MLFVPRDDVYHVTCPSFRAGGVILNLSHATSRENYTHLPKTMKIYWRQRARVGKFSFAVFEMVSLKFLETNIGKDGTITHYDLFHAVSQNIYFRKYFI